RRVLSVTSSKKTSTTRSQEKRGTDFRSARNREVLCAARWRSGPGDRRHRPGGSEELSCCAAWSFRIGEVDAATHVERVVETVRRRSAVARQTAGWTDSERCHRVSEFCFVSLVDRARQRRSAVDGPWHERGRTP